jgi:TetR/AcrR family transcriptional repressor of nem operon
MPRPSHRDKIITAGVSVFESHGYHGSSVRDIVAEAGVPMGSFTNHFRSKQLFALLVIDRNFGRLREAFDITLLDSTKPAIERLDAYFDIAVARLRQEDFRSGCLLGKLAQEMADQDNAIQNRLSEAFKAWQGAFEVCIRDGLRNGEFESGLGASKLAEFILSSWQGAMLRMKIDGTNRPLSTFRQALFSQILIPAKSTQRSPYRPARKRQTAAP